MDNTRTSIVMVCFNQAGFLEEAIRSVIAQTYTGWELIIVDDGSSDGSPEIIAKYVRAFPGKISLLRHPGGGNEGISASYRLGISAAKGDHVAFLEGDDSWRTDNLEKKLKVFSGTRAGLVYSAVKAVGERGLIEKRARYLGRAGRMPANVPFKAAAALLWFNFITTFSTVIITRELAKRAAGYLRSGEYQVWLDWLVWLRLSSTARFYYLPEELVFWRMSRDSYCTKVVCSAGRAGEISFQLRYRFFLLKQLLFPRKAVIEIGCGEGLNTYLLSKRNDAVGIDISGDNIALARKKFPGVDFRVMDAGKLEFEDGFFDQVFCLDVLEHVDNLDRVTAEISRVLKPGGECVAIVPYWKSERWLLKLRPSYFEEIHHVRIFEENSLEELMAAKNFRLARKSRQGFLTHLFFFYIFKRKSGEKSQLAIGDMRTSWLSKAVFAAVMIFDPGLFRTPLRYCPLWIVTLPVGLAVNIFGNIFFPKSLFYKFIKNG